MIVSEAVVLAGLECYKLTITLIMAIREDMPKELREKQWKDLLDAQKRADVFWQRFADGFGKS